MRKLGQMMGNIECIRSEKSAIESHQLTLSGNRCSNLNSRGFIRMEAAQACIRNTDASSLNVYALMVDGDNAGGAATGWFADIAFKAQ